MTDTTVNEMGLPLVVTDVAQQRRVKLRLDKDSLKATVAELIRAVLPKLGLPSTAGPEGTPLPYTLRVERDGGRIAGGNEIVDEALSPGDHVVIQPDIRAA